MTTIETMTIEGIKVPAYKTPIAILTRDYIDIWAGITNKQIAVINAHFAKDIKIEYNKLDYYEIWIGGALLVPSEIYIKKDCDILDRIEFINCKASDFSAVYDNQSTLDEY